MRALVCERFGAHCVFFGCGKRSKCDFLSAFLFIKKVMNRPQRVKQQFVYYLNARTVNLYDCF